MRSVRVLAVVAATCIGLLIPATAHAAPLQFFTEVAHADLDSYGSGSPIPLKGDFNADGIEDIFIYRPGSGEEMLLPGNAGRGNWIGNVSDNIQVNGTYIPVVGDFNGNGTTDILWYAPGGGIDTLWAFHTTSSFTVTKMRINGTYKPFVGDFTSNDGRGADDIFWYAPGSGADSIWQGASGSKVTFTSIPQSISGTYTPLVGSFTPDPATGGSTDSTLDVFWYAPGTTADSLWRGDGNGHFSPKAYNVGGTYKPIVGFFDGYGVQDIFWFSPNGTDSVWLADPDTHAFTAHSVAVGPGYTPITGEFTIPDEPILWWSPSGTDHFWLPEGEPGTWAYSELSNNTDMGSGYKPVALDFDGDGHNDIVWLGDGSPHSRIFWGPG